MRLNFPLYFSCLFTIFLLSSCLTLEADLSFRQDGSGTLSLNYTLDKKFMGIHKDGSPFDTLIPLPMSQQEFTDRAAAQSGMSLTSLSGEDDLETVSLASDLNFTSLQTLSGITGIPMELEQDGNRTSLRIVFFQQEQIVPAESVRLLSSSLLNNSIDIRIEVPGLIRSSSLGGVAGDNRSVRYRGSIDEFYEGREFVWELEWLNR